MAPASKWTLWLLWSLRVGWTIGGSVGHRYHARPLLSACDWQHQMHSSQFAQNRP